MKNNSRRSKSQRPKPSSLPPIAVAIARMVEPNSDVINPAFLRAWQAMPAIVAAYATGTSDGRDIVSADNVISTLVDEAICDSRQKTEDNLNPHLAEAKDLLEAHNPDHWDSVYCAIEDRAFTVGLALGIYVMLHGGAR